jgi:hypothetical protein
VAIDELQASPWHRVARAILVAGLVGTVYGVLVTEPSVGWRGWR